MTLKEKLLGATRVAAEAYNLGQDPSKAVIKAAKDFNFNKDQTERLTEMFNTALTLHEFKKHASDRTAEFPLADKAEVVKGLYEEEKKAEAPKFYDYSFYDKPSENLVKAASVPMEKAASFEVNEETTPELDLAEKMRYINLAKEAAAEAADTEEKLRQSMVSELYKLANMISYREDAEDHYRRLKQACADCPKIIDNLNRVLPPRLRKIAEEKTEKKDDEWDVMDFSDVRDEEDMIRKLQGMMNHVNEFHMTSVSFSKKAEDMWQKVATDYFHHEKEDVFDKVFKKAAGIASITSALMPLPTSADIPNWDEEKQKRDLSEALEDNEESNNLVRSEILNDLVVSDPIISEADPADVTRAYQTIVSIAPQVSMHKEIVRSMLRQAVNSVALSPYDAKAYVDLNNALLGKIRRDA